MTRLASPRRAATGAPACRARRRAPRLGGRRERPPEELSRTSRVPRSAGSARIAARELVAVDVGHVAGRAARARRACRRRRPPPAAPCARRRRRRPRSASATSRAGARGSCGSVALSSTTRTRRPASVGELVRRGVAGLRARHGQLEPERAAAAELARRRRPRRPSARRAAWRSRDRGPVPPYWRVVEPSACANGSKSCSSAVGRDADAGVGDLEAHERRAVARGRRRWPARTTSPSAVNLIALQTRLVSTWRSRAESPRTSAGTLGTIASRELEALLVRPRGEHPAGPLDRLAQVEVGRLELELAGLDLREVEDVVDDRQQRLAGGARSPRRTRAARRRARCRAAARSCRSRRSSACGSRG